ncbi:excinuclease ABC subunit UvrA [Candidatus Collierbacteria bacterium]|nr:excinuclease ABC subunit UvrA [Candidatus Collierbacteria bacterium]
MENYIEVIGAKQHNLKNISVKIPKNKLTVITGVSGSGKSSLAFDTIFAEGQRRYVESLSSYARQFLGVMNKPDVDKIIGLSPAIAINQKAVSSNPRSTVGTVTEIYDYLRVLYSRAGHPHCEKCGREVKRQSVDQISDSILDQAKLSAVGQKPCLIEIFSPIIVDKKGEFTQLFESLRRDGFKDVTVDGQKFNLNHNFVLIKTNRHTIELSVDKISVTKKDFKNPDGLKLISSRLSETVEIASKKSGGTLLIQFDGKDKTLFSQSFACPVCNISLPDIEPRSFSFNTPYGACPECDGLGTILSADPEAEEKIPNLLNRYLETDNEAVRKRLIPFIITSVCPSCNGQKLNKISRNVTVAGKNIAEISNLAVKDCLSFIEKLNKSDAFSPQESAVSTPIVRELSIRLKFLIDVGLEYLTLGRTASSLSSGEAQRIRLASQIGTGLTGVLYVLDEPTIGLHQRDNSKLIQILKSLRDLGNTVLVVEHDQETIENADWMIEIGPKAGKNGGEIIAEGTVEDIKNNKKSLTGDYLAGRKKVEIQKVKRLEGYKANKIDFSTCQPANLPTLESIKLSGASQHNLKSVDVEFPMGKFICVTGVSGSGKSTLVHDTLYHALARRLNRYHHTTPGKFESFSLPNTVSQVSLIDQSPIGRTPRSNPATYSGVFDYIRQIFSQTKESRIRGWKSGRFSFNIPGGRCETCEGQGQIKVEMQFMPDVYVICDDCKGTRFGRETLEVVYSGKNIAEILNLTINEACEMFAGFPALKSRLLMLRSVGLGYLSLGQPATILSGGEAQRMKLSRELGKIRSAHTIYLLDEPTTGLHFDDLQKLIEVLLKLVNQNNTVIVVEHNLDVIRNAEWIIDLGPEGGDEGGEIVAVGTPEQIANNPKSYTGRYLKKLIN